ncbi:hypothetical protein ACWF94_14365 [Streptomyces sp. NPDC055078]
MSPSAFHDAQPYFQAEYGRHEACEHAVVPRRTADGSFPEIERLTQDCRFADCEHGREPDCAVMDAVTAGEIPKHRLDGYQQLLREDAYAAARTDARLRADREAAKKDITRHLRATYRFRERQL